LIDWLIVLYLYPDENRFNKLSVGENVVLRRNYCLRIFDLDFGTFPTVWYFVLWVFIRQTHVPITKWHEQIIPCQFPTITPCQFPCIYHIFNMILSVSHVPITPCQFPMYKSHLVGFPCTYHTLSVSHVPITPCQFPMYLSHLVSFPCMYHTLSVSHVPITPCKFPRHSKIDWLIDWLSLTCDL
jgi:hypothetical protein